MCKLCEVQPNGTCRLEGCKCGKPVGLHGCTGHSKRTKLLCNAKAMKGKHVCKFHGGKSKVGSASPTIKHGLYSKHLPTRYLAHYGQFIDDPRLVDLRHQLAMTFVRETELQQMFQDGSAEERVAEGREAFTQLVEHLAERMEMDAATMAMVDSVTDAFDAATNDGRVWRELFRIYDKRAEWAKEQNKIELGEQKAMPAAQVFTLVTVVLAAARRFIASDDDYEAFGLMVEGMAPVGLIADVSGSSSDEPN